MRNRDLLRCDCDRYDDCPHPEGRSFCNARAHRFVVAVGVSDGLPWCEECYEGFRYCEKHGEDGTGILDNEGHPLCSLCQAEAEDDERELHRRRVA